MRRQHRADKNVPPQQVIPLPKCTQEVVRQHSDEIDNFSLLYYKLGERWLRHGRDGLRLDKTIFKDKFEPFRISDELLKSTLFRVEKIVNALKERLQYERDSFTLTTSWRLIMGLGGAHILKTSMTLHHLYGIPIIPGSALKGLARAYAVLEKFGGDEKKAEKDKGFSDIFGSQKERGKVIFMDAYPAIPPTFAIDIMNPHYQPYYSYKTNKVPPPPADYHSPVPVNFLTVERTPFGFWLLAKDERCLTQAKKWLEEGLKQLGAGAKTMAGYGYFEQT